MWRDWRKWHPNTIKANCFWGLRKRDLLQSLPKRCSQIQTWINSGKSSKNGSKKDPQQPPPFVFIITISRVIIIKCILFIEMFLQGRKEKKKKKKDCIMDNISLPFFGRAAVDEVKSFSNAIWKSTALITRLNFQFSHRYAHTHRQTDTHTARRIQNEAVAQNNLPDRLSDTKTHRQKGKDRDYVNGWRDCSDYSYVSLKERNTMSFTPLKGPASHKQRWLSLSHYMKLLSGEMEVAARHRTATGPL